MGELTPPPALTLGQTAAVQRLLEAEGIFPLVDQVERAGQALATVAQGLADTSSGQPIIVLAGTGNTGAVGLVAARVLHGAGLPVRVVLSLPPAGLHPLAAEEEARLRAVGVQPWALSLRQEEMDEQEPIAWLQAALVVDALLGTGLEGDPRAETADLIRLVNAARRPILACDLPSGVGGDEGLIHSPCIRATATLALGLPHWGLLEAWPVAGEVWLANLGVPVSLYEQLGLAVPDLFAGQTVVRLGAARALAAQR